MKICVKCGRLLGEISDQKLESIVCRRCEKDECY